VWNWGIRRNYRFQYGSTQGIGAEITRLARYAGMPILSASALVEHILTYVEKDQWLFIATFRLRYTPIVMIDKYPILQLFTD